jgi:hypothetical protein
MAAARLALQRGLEVLGDEPNSPRPLLGLPEPSLLEDATEALELLVELDVGRLDPDAISALGTLDLDVLRALRRLDVEVLDALSALDTSSIHALERLIGLDDRLDRILDRYEESPDRGLHGPGRRCCAQACTEVRG